MVRNITSNQSSASAMRRDAALASSDGQSGSPTNRLITDADQIRRELFAILVQRRRQLGTG